MKLSHLKKVIFIHFSCYFIFFQQKLKTLFIFIITDLYGWTLRILTDYGKLKKSKKSVITFFIFFEKRKHYEKRKRNNNKITQP
jgi:hypothetical protein